MKKSRLVICVSGIAACFISMASIVVGYGFPNTTIPVNTGVDSLTSSGNVSSAESSLPPSSAASSSSASDSSCVSSKSVSSVSISSTPASSVTPSSSTQVESQPINQRVAYMTFDDGPSAITPQLLDVLKSCEVHATFFVIGRRAEQYPDMLKRMVTDGHVVGIHSWTHDFSYIYSSTDNFLEDFNKLKDFITQTTGVTPNVCRLPGGTNNTACFAYNKDHIMQKIVPLVQKMGFQYFDWNSSSGEASGTPPSKEKIVNMVISQCRSKKSAVILFHDFNNQGYVDAVPEIVSQLRSMGFVFNTLSPDSPPKSEAGAFQFTPS